MNQFKLTDIGVWVLTAFIVVVFTLKYDYFLFKFIEMDSNLEQLQSFNGFVDRIKYELWSTTL